MRIFGSCSCGAVRYAAESKHPVPYMRCYCSICVKTAGGGGYCINTSALLSTLEVTGPEHVKVYRATIVRGGKQVTSKHQRHFCAHCGSHLWAFHENWPDLIHPVAGSLDSQHPPPSENVHIMLGSKLPWVKIEGYPGDARFDEYPEKSIADFHDGRGWTVS